MMRRCCTRRLSRALSSQPAAAAVAAAAAASPPPPPPPPALTALSLHQPLPASSPAHAHVWEVRLARPRAGNALSCAMFGEIQAVFAHLGARAHPARAVLLSGEGPHFCAGLDLREHAPLLRPAAGADPARAAAALREMIVHYQRCVGAVAACGKPVIAAVHGACVGGGVDLVAAADVRLASGEAWFQVAEVAVGLAADLGSLQRLPRALGASLARELALTARRMGADEAARAGFVSSAVPADAAALREHALSLAARMAALSPVAVQGTKAIMNFSQGRTVEDGLAFAAAHNAGALQTRDIAAAAGAAMQGLPPALFRDL